LTPDQEGAAGGGAIDDGGARTGGDARTGVTEAATEAAPVPLTVTAGLPDGAAPLTVTAADASVAPAVWPPPATDGGIDAAPAVDLADVLAGPALDVAL